MKAQPNDGGPAFPNMGEIFIDGPQGRQPQSAWGMDGDKGMSLRDWFAGMALMGYASNPAEQFTSLTHDRVAEFSYRDADAMLAARGQAGQEKEPESEWSEWIEWGGGKCPVPDETPVCVRLEGGLESPEDLAKNWTWTHRDITIDIVAYRVRKGGNQ